MGPADDVVQRKCDLKDISTGEELTVLSINFDPSFRAIITLDRTCVQENPWLSSQAFAH